MAKAEFKYGKLAAGRIDYILRVTASAGTYAVGDVLETSNGLTYAKATADASLEKHYAVCAEDTTLSGSGEIVAYKGGYFNKNIVKINDKELTDNSIEILKTQNIFVEDVAEQ